MNKLRNAGNYHSFRSSKKTQIKKDMKNIQIKIIVSSVDKTGSDKTW